MAEPVRRMERAFFERLALVRPDGNSIRRSMAASSFYAAVWAVWAKKNGGSNRTAVNQVLFCAQKAVCPAAVFFFSAAGQIIEDIKTEPITYEVFPQCYRLCVLASGSCTMDRFSCRTAIKVSCLHLGQNNGKFSRMVSLRILNRVLLPQTGHNTHSIWLISLLPAASNPIFLDMTGVRMYFVHKRPSCSHCKCDVTAFNRHENIPTGKIQISHRVFGQPHNTVLRNMQPSIASSFIANEFSFINRVLWQCGTII